MDKIAKNKLYNRITYFCFALIMLVTLVFPMFKINQVTGEEVNQKCASVTAMQIINVAFRADEDNNIRAAELAKVVEEKTQKIVSEQGKTASEAEKMLANDADYNEYTLINAHLKDTIKLDTYAIILVVAYALTALVALLVLLNIFAKSNVLDIVCIYASIAAAIGGVLTAVFAFDLTISTGVDLVKNMIVGDMVLYVFALGLVALAVVETVQFFIARRSSKVAKEEDVARPFTDEVSGGENA